MYTYRGLKEAINELSEEELDQAVVIIDEYNPDNEAYLMCATDTNDKYGGNGMEPFRNKLPEGQSVLVLDKKYIEKPEDVLIHWKNS